MAARHQLDDLILQRKQDPIPKTVIRCQLDQELNERRSPHRARPAKSLAHVARVPGRAGKVIDDHAWNPTPAEAPHHTERLEIAPQHHRPGPARRSRHRNPDASPQLARAARRATWRAATFAPATKLQSGPKLYPATPPTKWRPGMEDSNHRLSTGSPLRATTARRTEG